MKVFIFLVLFFKCAFATFPFQKLTECGVSNETISGIHEIINEHQKLIDLAANNKRAKNTEVQSMKAAIDQYVENSAPEEDKSIWLTCMSSN
ncbi:unnamed protein product [Caenorhabditis angaria]|uniref:SXP/RAL-2 family protein Ani s 5-like cation-binding domain-containing protein n=1 Tax=Caenorhabditis angaria TaxID=860376 RepID=A0A9P1IWS6_9PELO|nr:unnamed protein product [Caenorhabditis angaria]